MPEPLRTHLYFAGPFASSAFRSSHAKLYKKAQDPRLLTYLSVEPLTCSEFVDLLVSGRMFSESVQSSHRSGEPHVPKIMQYYCTTLLGEANRISDRFF